MNDNHHTKVAIVGTGMVGSAFAYALLINGVARSISLIDYDPELAKGEAMDLRHSLSFLQPVQVEAGGYELCRDASVVVVTAGAAQKPGETRLDLTRKNAAIIKGIIPRIIEHNPDPIIIMVANPVDILTHVALKESGLAPSRVIGSGTVLDSSRFRHVLSQNCMVDVRNVHAHVIGEHGDSEVMVWSRANIAGVPLDELCPVCSQSCALKAREGINDKVRKAAYEIIRRKKSTNWAVGLAVTRIVEAILGDQHSVLAVSALTNGPYGLKDVCLSLPRVVGGSGVERELAFPLAPSEETALIESGRLLAQHMNSLD